MPEATAHTLYPQSRLDNMTIEQLTAVLALATYDIESDARTVYDGMTRDETVATAQRTKHTMASELRDRLDAIEQRVHLTR
jgi:hypothetical protein